MMSELFVIKIGGNIIDDDQKISTFLKNFSGFRKNKILVHGGGKLASKLAEQLNVPQKMVDGRRITDAETLKIAVMVYAGYINKKIVAELQANGCNAIGMTGADGNSLTAHKRVHPTTDFGFVGDVDGVQTPFFQSLLKQSVVPVVAPITHDSKGQLLNTNADTIAQEIAKAMSGNYETTLIYLFEKSGVLANLADENSVISKITLSSFSKLKEQKTISDGMIPKLENAFAAINSGVKSVIIGKAEDLQELSNGIKGTTIVS